MGCDIHAYVEYKKADNNGDWISFGGRINPGRNYSLFGRMAEGVRTDPSFRCQIKGLPSDLGYQARNDNQLYISGTGNDDEGYCTVQQAEQWVKNGSSFYIEHQGKNIWVTHPDWHSHSWLTVEEFASVIDDYKSFNPAYQEPEYEALLSAMRKFVDLGYQCRLVFWFDN